MTRYWRCGAAGAFALGWGLVMLAGCGGSSTELTSSGAGGTETGNGQCGGGHPAPVGRPAAAECLGHSTGVLSTSVEAPVSCNTDADCGDPTLVGAHQCLKGTCLYDQCLSDTDCAANEVCVCQEMLRWSSNRCIAMQCRVDADCGANGTCSPSFTDACGRLAGYYCHSADDTCSTDADCCGSTARCGYQPELGHWACQASPVCNG